ncbi:MAG: HalOD1 output domain-containing protein [Halobacteriota archaeon]|uniref:HalOD1 output domain-containing protein n=1 Tax=Natronomonas sp. TaxID=2184060 RepID=UPI00397712CD
MTTSDDDNERERAHNERVSESDAHEVTTKDGFHEKLQALVTEASSNGVDIRGSWPVAGSERRGSWNIEIRRIGQRSMFRVDESDDFVGTIVGAVAVCEGVEVTDLPSLYGTIDPEILDELLQSADDDARRYVRFQYCGYEITARADGSVLVDK